MNMPAKGWRRRKRTGKYGVLPPTAVYYYAPKSEKVLRSITAVAKHLAEQPHLLAADPDLLARVNFSIIM